MSVSFVCCRCKASAVAADEETLYRSGWQAVEKEKVCPDCTAIPRPVEPEVSVPHEVKDGKLSK